MGDWAHNLKFLSEIKIDEISEVNSHRVVRLSSFIRRENKLLLTHKSVTVLVIFMRVRLIRFTVVIGLHFIFQHSHLNNELQKSNYNSIQIIYSNQKFIYYSN